jgi:hypothetical protein
VEEEDEQEAQVQVTASDSGESSDGASVAIAPDWPIEDQYQALRAFEPAAIVNASGLGDLAFNGADERLREIVAVLSDLRLEPWRYVDPEIAGQLQSNAANLQSTLEQMSQLRSSQQNVHNDRNQLEANFNNYHQFFLGRVRPLCMTARVVDVFRNRRELLGVEISPDQVEQLESHFRELRDTAAELQRLAPLVEAQRQLVEEGGVAKLSAAVDVRATEARNSFRNWALALAAGVLAGGFGSGLFVYLTRPDPDAGTAEIASYLALDVFVIGIVVFVVRFLALQTRAHRHVEFVARNKANALSTFNLIVSGQTDPEVRAQVAAALAQAVFKSEDGIFSDASSDSVTIIERVVGSAANRTTAG